MPTPSDLPSDDERVEVQATYAVAMHLQANAKAGRAVRWFTVAAVVMAVYLHSLWPLAAGAILAVATYFFIINSCLRFVQSKIGMPSEIQAVFSRRYKTDVEFAQRVDRLAKAAVATVDAMRKGSTIRETAREDTSDSNLRAMLKEDFGIDLPISGGIGNSRDGPVVIHYRVPNDYVAVEHTVLRCLGTGRRVEWKLLQQTLIEHNGRKLDQMKIETKETTDTEIITQIENYYFDVTECLGR
jgi:hypothetical protein